jgi:hypothetical protein
MENNSTENYDIPDTHDRKNSSLFRHGGLFSYVKDEPKGHGPPLRFAVRCGPCSANQ